MGFHTIDLALFVPADLAVTARNWLKKNYDMTVTGRPLIRENDADDHAPRYYGIELQATPEMHSHAQTPPGQARVLIAAPARILQRQEETAAITQTRVGRPRLADQTRRVTSVRATRRVVPSDLRRW